MSHGKTQFGIVMQQRTPAQPVQQFIAIGRVQNGMEGVLALGFRLAGGNRQQG